MGEDILRKSVYILLAAVILILAGCSVSSETTLVSTITQELPPTITPTQVPSTEIIEHTITPEAINEDSPAEEDSMVDKKEIVADIVSVKVSGSEHQYQFSVGISSPDTGCEQYADWWEVLSENGELIYRRILQHSHVNEQPFIRSGGPVNIERDTVVIIRAHMNRAGYGGLTLKGSVDSGFINSQIPLDFAPGIENLPPLPTGCNF